VKDTAFFKGAKIIFVVTNTAKLVNSLLFTVPLKLLVVKRKNTENSHNSSRHNYP
jgi:hypothetical protein